MTNEPRRGGRIAAALVLVLVPLALAGGILLLRRPSSPQPGTTVVPQGEQVPLDKWPDGKPRVLAREWTDAGVAWEEHCFLSDSGEAMGCGLLRDGTPWEGTFASWHVAGGAFANRSAPLKEIGQYRQGKRQGIWRTFHVDGAQAIEVEYRDGAQFSKKVIERNGNQVVEQGKRLTGIPESRRTGGFIQ